MKEEEIVDLGGLYTYEKSFNSLDGLISSLYACKQVNTIYITKPEFTLSSDRILDYDKLEIHVTVDSDENIVPCFYDLYKKIFFIPEERDKTLDFYRKWTLDDFEKELFRKFEQNYILKKKDVVTFQNTFGIWEECTKTTTKNFSSIYFSSEIFDNSRIVKIENFKQRSMIKVYFHTNLSDQQMENLHIKKYKSF